MTDCDITAPAPVLAAIDISKERHEVLIEAPDKKRRRRVSVLNNLDEFDRVISLLRSYQRPVRVAFEATGNYHRALAYQLGSAASSPRASSPRIFCANCKTSRPKFLPCGRPRRSACHPLPASTRMRSALPKTSRPSSHSPLLPTGDHKWKIPVLNGLIYWGHVITENRLTKLRRYFRGAGQIHFAIPPPKDTLFSLVLWLQPFPRTR